MAARISAPTPSTREKPKLDEIYLGGALDILRSWPDGCVDMCLTSPPYWALRDYGNATTVWGGNPACRHRWTAAGGALAHENRNNLRGSQEEVRGKTKAAHIFKYDRRQSRSCAACGAWKGQLGLEPSFELYVKHLCEIFHEVYRVLKPTGTCWVNLNDTYAGSWCGFAASQAKQSGDSQEGPSTSWPRRAYADPTFKPPSATKQSVPARSLCLIPERFSIVMSEQGWILRNHIVWHKPNRMPVSVKNRFAGAWEHVFFFVKQPKYYFDLDAVRMPHKTQSLKLCGATQTQTPTRRLIRRPPRGGEPGSMHPKGKNPGDCWEIATRAGVGGHLATYPEPLCQRPIKCGCPLGGVVLDPFSGSGTTLTVARKLGRRFVGIEINPDSVKLAKKRIANSGQEPV